MPNFQGSGFSVDVPDGCADASSYTFLLPSEDQYTAYVTIKFERFQDLPDLEVYANELEDTLRENVDDFQVIDKILGKHAGYDVSMSLVEWGPEESRICQRLAYFIVNDKTNRIYSFTGTDLKSNFKKSEPYINQMLKSFELNEIQVLDFK